MNAQNVPGRYNDRIGIRNFHVPAPGKIMFFIDFSGFELRIMAWKANDDTMIELFNTNGDMHKKTASVLTNKAESEITSEERNNAKAGNFGRVIGLMPKQNSLKTGKAKDSKSLCQSRAA